MVLYFRQKYDTGVSVEVFNFANVGSAAKITNEHKTLPAGSIVVCDLDFIYAKNDPNIKIGNPARIIKRYWIEQKRLKGNNIIDLIVIDEEREYDE